MPPLTAQVSTVPDLARRVVLVSGVFHRDGWVPGAIDPDPPTPEIPQLSAEVSPDGPEHFAELALIPGTSHGLLHEKPELCNALIVDFLINDPVLTLAPVRRANAASR